MSDPAKFGTPEFIARAKTEDKRYIRDVIIDKDATQLLWDHLKKKIVYDDTGLSCVEVDGRGLVPFSQHVKELIGPTGKFSYLGNIPGAKEAAINSEIDGDIEAARHTLKAQGELATKYPKDWQTMLARVGLKAGQLGGHAITAVAKPEEKKTDTKAAAPIVRGTPPPQSGNPWTQGADGEAERMRIIKTNARLATSLAKSAGTDIAGRRIKRA